MRLSDVFKYVESIDFAIQFTIISGWRIFQQALEENDTLRLLIDDLKQNPGHAQKVLDRLIRLAKTETDPAMEHPHDIALAAYLFVLSRVDSVLAYIGARQLQSLPNLWWSQRLANTVVESMSTASAQAVVHVAVTHDRSIEVRPISETKNSGNAAIRFVETALGVLTVRTKTEAKAS